MPAAPDNGKPPETAVRRLADDLFRRESGRLVSMLTGIFGIHRLELAEDVVQEALARALETWPYYGVPDNPPAWLMQTAKHLALDRIRRESRFRDKQPDIIADLKQRMRAEDRPNAAFDDEIRDDRLRLIFACCHPTLPLEMQTALALKVLCGFGPQEIARAFLASEAAVLKRLTRARGRLQADGVRFEIPAGPELTVRLDGVLATLYLLFNEGYKASEGDRIVRGELCREAIRLTELLAAHPVAGQPRVHALLSLMLLNAARLPARTDADGSILRLAEQDRRLWNRAMIQRGIYHLDRASSGDTLSAYHLQAGIAACHCLAADAASTDWHRILNLYDHLAEIDDSPVVAVNRAVAVARVHGPARAIRELERRMEGSSLDRYYLTHAVLGELEQRRDRHAAAAVHFLHALKLAEVAPERALLERRLRECRKG
ncbi:MAG: sigma-70 family RNA polymerase sigma factor [Opitutales bacterium]|nr:sigma-70 family RNA polymerase sigma factor [Opitutales bacterium]